ncbi:MAG: HD domain-containing protein [Ruminococcaceae bacterium]|nr:HD domain-containing protein [Oscillospiraceae bacterium]
MMLIILAGFVMFCLCAMRAIPYFQAQGLSALLYCIILFVLMVLCRMLPIYIGTGRAMDISFVPMLACAITSHYSVAVLLFTLSTFFSLLRDPVTREFFYPYKKNTLKEVFNTANVVIAMTVAGFLFNFLSPDPQNLASIRMILQSTGFALVNILLNFLVFILFFYLGDERRFATLIAKNIGGLLPNIVSTVPLALILGLLLQSSQGYLYVLLLMAPLLVARHSFKLYMDSHSMNLRTIATLCNAIEAKDEYTQGHSMRVAFFSKSIAEAMGKPAAFVEDMTVAAMLHDVGKIGINDAILSKTEPLTRAEYEEIKRHPGIGQKIINKVHFSQTINDAVLYHHLNYDKSGYPQTDNLPDKQPLAAAILAVADTYDAMTSDRPYRHGMEVEQACRLMEGTAGTQLDPEVLEVFLRILPGLDIPQMEADFELQLELLT